jgi:hypothetical protein
MPGLPRYAVVSAAAAGDRPCGILQCGALKSKAINATQQLLCANKARLMCYLLVRLLQL